MDNFISLLDNTLKMNSAVDKSDEEELMEVPVSPPKPRQNGRAQPAAQPQRKHSAEALRTPVEPKAPVVEELVPAVHKSASMPCTFLLVLPVCLFVGMSACVSMRVHVYSCRLVWMGCVCVCVRAHVFMCVCVCMSLCVYVLVCAHVGHLGMHTYTCQ